MISNKLYLLLCLPCLLVAGHATAQEADKPPKIFTTDQVLAATLEGPWKSITRRKESDRAWPGTFSFSSASGQQVRIPVSITTRGLTRKRICDFPPLRIDFDKEAAKGTEFRGAGSLKLVTHCFYQDRYQDYYIKEFLAYRLYNQVTDMSFRVQGLDLDYSDGPDDSKPTRRFAFLIEDPDDVAERNGMVKLAIEETRPSALDAVQTSRFMLFQYMIGNLDWSVLGGPGERCCHNVRLLGSGPDATLFFPVPYDLDSSGLADVHYAAPPKALRVRNIRQRLYRGFCAHNAALPGVAGEFRALEQDFDRIISAEPRLGEREQERSLEYLQEFYTVLASDKTMQREFNGNCRG